MFEMCNPRQGEGQRVLEEDDLDRIALIAHYWLSASHDLRLGMDGMLLALCDHGFERSG